MQPHAKKPEALFSSRRWFLEPPEPRAGHARPDGSAAARPPGLLRITTSREQGEHVVATAQGIDDRDAAQALAGCRVFVARSSFPTAGDGEHYWVDLIGLAVVDRDGATLGTVAGLVDTGPHCVLELEPGGRMIPFVSAYIDSVDVPAGRIVADWRVDWWQ